MLIFCSWSARGSARHRAAATRLIDVPKPQQTLVHVHPGAEELGLIYAPDLPIHAGMRAFAAAARALEPVDSAAWREQTKVAHEQYLASLQPKPTPGALQLGEVMAWLREHLPRGCDRHQRRRQLLRLGQRLLPVPALSQPARPDQRLDGLRHAGGDRRQAGPPRAHRGLRSRATAIF